MKRSAFIKATLVWCLFVVFAIINGILRESILVNLIGMRWALPVSGISLSLVVLVICYFTIEWMGGRTRAVCLQIGVLWVLLTLAFEFLFGHYVANKSWLEILQVFNLVGGNLFSLVLLVCLVGPWLMLKMRQHGQKTIT